MAKLTITTGNPQIDGEYELDLSKGFRFTKAEWYLMSKHVGIVMENLKPGSPLDENVMTAFGLVLLSRAGKAHLFGAFMETTDEQTEWEWDAAEVVDDGLEDPSLPPPTGSGLAETHDENKTSSGLSTNGSSDTSQDETLAATGSLL